MHVTVESLMGSLLHAVHDWAHSCSVCSQALCSWGYKFHPHCWILWLGYIFILILRCDSYVVELTCSPPESGNGASDYDSPSTKWFSFERVLIYGCPNIVPFFHLREQGHCKVDVGWSNGWLALLSWSLPSGGFISRRWDVSLVHSFRGANGAQH